MATSKSYFARANYRFLPSDQALSNDSMIFELDESDVWNSSARSQSPDVRKTSSRITRKSSPAAASRGGVGGPASLPVNVPDWSKILKEEYRRIGGEIATTTTTMTRPRRTGAVFHRTSFWRGKWRGLGSPPSRCTRGLGEPSKVEI
ncbi:UNVERIFIED_CONTAM: hypothetical protein Sangu_0284300 [Sesamum angustifolium]|uniref:Uncharacterized protein n=1 Tax=Sesamum angustifolium TaxID=2727405 RepID=A0AAW2QQ65_9LAMI